MTITRATFMGVLNSADRNGDGGDFHPLPAATDGVVNKKEMKHVLTYGNDEEKQVAQIILDNWEGIDAKSKAKGGFLGQGEGGKNEISEEDLSLWLSGGGYLNKCLA